MQSTSRHRGNVFAFALAVAAGPVGAGTIESNFEDATAQGWTFLGDVDVATIEPGGTGDSSWYLQVVDLGTGGTMTAVAPAGYLGDWSAYDGVGTLSADVGLLGLVIGGTQSVPAGFTIVGPGGSASANFGVPPVGPWLHYSAPIREDEWTVTAGTWAGLIQNVTSLSVRVEFGTGLDVTGLDNVRLTSDPVLRWWTLDGGGGDSSSGDLMLRGTIGQVDANALSAGNVELRGGYWSPGVLVTCETDLDGSGATAVPDLLVMLGQWGSCAGCPGDLNDDGMVDVVDLLELLGAWGPCP